MRFLLHKIILFLFFGFSFGQQIDLSQFDSYFQNLKELEHQKALKSLNLDTSIEYYTALTTFSNLTFEGFTGNPESYKSLLTKKPSADLFQTTLHLLNKGYFEFYFSENRTASYPYFYEALLKADQLGYVPLQKRVLLAILDYFHHEIARNNNNYTVFLERYKELSTDIHDTVYHRIYQVIFYSSELNIPPIYTEKAGALLDLSTQLAEGCKLLPKLYLEIALYNELTGNLDKAETYYKKVFELGKNIPYYLDSRFSVITKLAYIEYLRGNPEKALVKLEEISCCYNPRDSLKNHFFKNYYLSKFYEGMDKDSLALATYKKHVEAGHKINFRDNSLEISRLQVELETEKKEILLLQEQQEKKNILLITFGLLAALGILSLLAYFIINNSKKRRKLAEKTRDLEKQRVSNILKDQELASIDAMIAGQEKERTRIAGELHDDLGALMTNVRMHFEALKTSGSEELYQKTDDLLKDAYNKVRSIAQAKNSGVLATEGLLKAVKDLAHKISQLNGLQIEIVEHGMTTRLENSLELSIFRIIQELITNIIKHAQAKTATIHLINHEELLNIMIEDDGIGFDPKHISTRSSGMGIANIDKRVAYLNGSLTIESEEGSGTSIIIDIPI